ncbi:carbohydrate porin [Haloferula sp. A504]|uniref:carbohydrate porin n=1 Tax=Haloferula sp. A504 TaxID=3373601 RepID=UPI0031BFC21F|nr:carbohydrate porin [Verrucomicrobiaceae bacterium E54]
MPFILLLFLVGGTPVVGEEPVLPGDIAREIESTGGGAGLLPVLEEWDKTRDRIDKEIGLSWSVRYDTVALGAALGHGVPVGASGDFTLQGIWAPARRWSGNPTELRFRLRDRHALGGRAASELGPGIGALWGVVDGFSGSGFEVPDFFFRHVFERSGIELRYGQMTIDAQFGGHQLASAKNYFLNQAFASSPAVAFPRFGAGITLAKSFDNGFSIGLGSTTVQGTQQGAQVDLEFGSDDLFHALQFAYDFKGADVLPRRIQLLGWHSDAVEDAGRPGGQGLQLIHERALSADGSRIFVKLAWADGGATPVDCFLAAGFGRPCGDHDFLGLAAGIGRGSGPAKDWQGVIEGFYRWHPWESLRISPDVQLLFGEGFNGSPGIRVVAGLRAGLVF